MTSRTALGASLVCLAFFAAPSAQAQTLRYATTAPGGVLATGNTLGLSKATDENGPGIRDSIGTFLSLGNGVDNIPFNPLNAWPSGTTYLWTNNGSAADLALPSEASVLYAELLWGGSYAYGTEDVSAFLGSSVVLGFGASQVDVPPDGATALTVDSTAASGFPVKYYLRSADVTTFVKSKGSGTYDVSGVPATQETNINSLNAAGWTLVVAYRDETARVRNMSVFVGGSFVDEASQQDYTVSGFCAPPAGEITGTAIVSTIEGDANLTGDQLLIAPSAAGPFVSLSGPNNPADNFFCSQLNDANGQLDTSGTFGAMNHDPFAGVNLEGGRQGWDVTSVPLSSQTGQLSQSQTSAVLRTITTGDSYMPILAAFAIDVNAPDLSGAGSTMDASATTVTLGDTYTLTATLTNGGQVVAEGLTFSLPIANGLSLVSFSSDGASGDLSGAAVDAAGLLSGAFEGDLAPGQTRTVSLVVSVDSAPPSDSFLSLATWSYAYEACAGSPLLSETLSQSAVVTYEAPPTTGATTTSATTGAGGAGGATSGAGGELAGSGGSDGVGGGSVPTDTPTAEEGCGCAVPGSAEGDARWATLVVFAGAAVGFLRRVRRD